MKVSQIMTPTILVIDMNASVIEAARKMQEFDVGFLAVVSDYSVLGILTDRDIVIRAVGQGKDINSCLVKDIATRNPVTCSADAEAEEAAQLFSQRQINRILVVDKNNTPVGVFSLGDLASKIANDKLTGSILRQVKQEVASRMIPWIPQEQKPTEIRHETL
jgi:CBS domain-containing protein